MMKGYWGPTPKKWRQLGDALLATSTIIATYSISIDYKWTGVVALIMGVVGKFLSNFFTDDSTPPAQ